MKWVSYTRTVSCRPEEDTPADIIGQQNEHIQKYAKEHGWKISAKYSDRKNTSEAMDAFRTMQQDGVNRSFDGIIIDSIFRCGCDLWAALEVLYHTFYKAGIQFAVVEDDFCSLEHDKNEVAEYFAEKEKIRRYDYAKEGRNKLETCGFLSVRNLRYGYVLSDDRRGLVIDREVEPIIKRIFLLYIEGKGYKDIADMLQEEGITPPQEHKIKTAGKIPNIIAPGIWHSASIHRILENPIYMGEGITRVNNTKRIIHVEPIVSKDIFEKVQARIHEQAPRQQKWKTGNANILCKRIYDKGSGKIMMCIKSPFEPDKKVYSIQKSARYLNKEDQKKVIPYETVISSLLDALRKIKEQVVYIDGMLESDDVAAYIETNLNPWREKAQEVFMETNTLCVERMKTHSLYHADAIEKADFDKMEQEYQQQFADCEKRFQVIMAKVKEIKKTYSRSNPWLAVYRDMEVPSDLVRDDVRKWIGLVFVEDFQNVELIPKEVDWRDRLPPQWLSMGREE